MPHRVGNGPDSLWVRLSQGVIPIVIITYPLAVWLGLKHVGTDILAPLLILIFMLRLLTFRGKLNQLVFLGKALAVAGIVLALTSWIMDETRMLLYYPVAVSSLLFILFFSSLFLPPPIIERLARLQEPDLTANALVYTRRVTQVWCVFFIFNGSVALYTCWHGDLALWTLYNGGVSYLLIGLLMGMEWIVRKRVRRI